MRCLYWSVQSTVSSWADCTVPAPGQAQSVSQGWSVNSETVRHLSELRIYVYIA